MKKLLIVLFSCFAGMAFGQVQSVDFLMKYNCQTNQYDICIIVLQGSATSIAQRAQFNSQISVVVPAGEVVSITEEYMPLKNNQNYDGNEPMDWILSNPVYAPAAQPENDFYSISPKLNTASFYNDLEVGDIVKLFSITVGNSGEYDESVRFFKNGIDPSDADPGMQGGDFSNGFTLGSPINIYNDNVEEACSITNIDENLLSEIKVYPNPVQNIMTIELTNDIESIKVLGSDGKTYYQSERKSKGIIKINASQFPAGIYYVKIKNGQEASMHKIVKF